MGGIALSNLPKIFLYLHVFDWPKNTGELRIPGLKNNINKTYHLSDTNKKELMFSAVGTDKIIKVGNQPSNANLSYSSS